MPQHNRQFTRRRPRPNGAARRLPRSQRKGFEYLGVGITWAAFNQRRDDTKPTWTLIFDALLDVFKAKRFDPSNPGANTAVGQGYHQFVWSTFVSKRFRWFEPYFGAWYILPARTNGSPFQKYGPTQTSVNPQQRAGVMIGVEQIAWENPRGDQRVTIEARAFVEEHFYGRERSEISGAAGGIVDLQREHPRRLPPGHRSRHPMRDGVIDAPHPGITDIDNYATLGGNLGLNVQVGKYIRFRSLFGFRSDLPHFITADGAGVDPNVKDDRVNPMDPRRGEPDLSAGDRSSRAALPRRGNQDLEPVHPGLDDVLRPARRD